MDGWLRNLIIVAVLILAGALFGAAGAAVAGARRSRMRDLADEGNRAARRVLALTEDPLRLTAAIQFIVTLLWLCAAGAATVGVGRILAGGVAGFPYPSAQSHSVTIAVVVVTVLLGLLVMIFGELVPKSLAARSADSLALRVVRPVEWATRLVSPAISLITFCTNLILKPFGATPRIGFTIRTEEELKEMVEAVEEEGVIEEEEKEMIASIFEFGDTVVRQVMVPRIDMKVMDVNGSVDEILAQIHEFGHSRIPVFRDNVDCIVGVIHAKDLLRVLRGHNGHEVSLGELMKPAFFVPENKKVSDLLREFRANKLQMAIVRDEYGGTAGLVTVEDLIEEIVGEISDEYDTEETPLTIQDGGSALVDARVSIDDLNEQIGTEFPEGEFETIGGLVFGLLGKEPEVGDSVTCEGWLLTVAGKEDRRLRTIRLDPVESGLPGAEPADQSASG